MNNTAINEVVLTGVIARDEQVFCGLVALAGDITPEDMKRVALITNKSIPTIIRYLKGTATDIKFAEKLLNYFTVVARVNREGREVKKALVFGSVPAAELCAE